jgi:hypothetical protein
MTGCSKNTGALQIMYKITCSLYAYVNIPKSEKKSKIQNASRFQGFQIKDTQRPVISIPHLKHSYTQHKLQVTIQIRMG